MTQPEGWKSPRQIEQEVREYRAKRFEDYMCLVDEGELTLALACAALREEVAYSEMPIGENAGLDDGRAA